MMEALPSLTDKLQSALGAIGNIGHTGQQLAPSSAYNPVPVIPVRAAAAPVFYNPTAVKMSSVPQPPDVATLNTGTVYGNPAHNVHRLGPESSVSRHGGGAADGFKPSLTSLPEKSKKPSVLLIVGIIVAVLAVGLLIAMYFIKKAAEKKRLKEQQEAEAMQREINAAELAAQQAAAEQAAAQQAAAQQASELAAQQAAVAEQVAAARAATAQKAHARQVTIVQAVGQPQAGTSIQQIDAQIAAARRRAVTASSPRVEEIIEPSSAAPVASLPLPSPAAALPPPAVAPVAPSLPSPADHSVASSTPLFALEGVAARPLGIDAHRLRIGEGVAQMSRGVQQAIMAQRSQGPREPQRDESVLMDRSAAMLHAPAASQTPLDSSVLAQPTKRPVLHVPTVAASGALVNLDDDDQLAGAQ